MAQSTPLQFTVPDMECQSCIASITKAIQGIDHDAHVAADLTSKRVIIGSDAEVHDLMQAIERAGFTVEAAG